VVEHDQELDAHAGPWSRRTVEDMRRVGPISERALEVLTQAMESPSGPWSRRIAAAGMRSCMRPRAAEREP
jgi:hypothetical protein